MYFQLSFDMLPVEWTKLFSRRPHASFVKKLRMFYPDGEV